MKEQILAYVCIAYIGTFNPGGGIFMKRTFKAVPKSKVTASYDPTWATDENLIGLCEDITYDCYDNNTGEYKYDDEFDMEAFIDDAAEHVIYCIKEWDVDGVYERFYDVVDDPQFQAVVRQLCEKYNEDQLMITRKV